jgi:hypothetical protein
MLITRTLGGWLATALASVVLVAVCAAPPPPAATTVPRPSAEPSLAVFEQELTAAGVRVVPGFSAAASRWQVTEFQAEVMDHQLREHQGFLGSELDAEAPMTKGGASVSYLIAAWIVGADTPRSKLVAGWLGSQDWKHAPDVVFPVAALNLFSIDMAEHMASAHAQAAGTSPLPGPPAQDLSAATLTAAYTAAASPCTVIDDFFSQAIVTLFGLLHLSPSFLGSSGPLSVVGGFVAKIWNTLVSLVQGALTGLVKTLTGPIVGVISFAVGTLAAISQIGAVMGAWNLDVTVTPPGNQPRGFDRFAVGSEPDHQDTIVLSASSLLDDVPGPVKDCARVLGTPLPSTLDPDTAVTWRQVYNADVVRFPQGLSTTVALNGTSTLDWTTGREASTSGRVVTGAAEVTTTLQNPGVTALASYAKRVVAAVIGQIIGDTLAPIVTNYLDGMLTYIVHGIERRLSASGFNRSADVLLVVSHHAPDSTPPANGNGGTPTASAKPPPPVDCDTLPSFGPPGTVVDQATGTSSTGFAVLTCNYTQGPKGIPLGWIQIETFRSPTAAAAFFNAGITGTPVPGFTEPVRFGGGCRGDHLKVCSRDEIALHGYRIVELAQESTPPVTPALPSLAQSNALMRRLLAIT